MLSYKNKYSVLRRNYVYLSGKYVNRVVYKLIL